MNQILYSLNLLYQRYYEGWYPALYSYDINWDYIVSDISETTYINKSTKRTKINQKKKKKKNE